MIIGKGYFPVTKSSGSDLMVTAGDSITKLALDLVPGAGTAKALYELIKAVSDDVGKYQEQRNEKRAEKFHQGLLGGTPTLIGGFLDVDDYHALLKICLNDIEGGKSKIYGQFARSIAAGKVNVKYKKYLIVVLSQLTNQQLDKLRRGWIATNYTLVPPSGSGSITPKKFLLGDESEIMDEMDHESLSVKKLVKEGALSKLGSELVEGCFRSDQLLPESIKETSWVGGALDVITAESKHHSTLEYLNRLLSLLHAGLIKANVYSPLNNFVQSEHLEVLPFCVVLIRDITLFKENLDAVRGMVGGRDTILAFIGKADKGIVKLFSVCDVLECSESDQKSQGDMMNKISQAIRRKVKHATVS